MALPADYITGTITLTNASNAFTGTGTGWQAADFREGDIILGIQDNAGVVYVVASILDNTSGTLTQPWAGPTGTYTYRMRYEWDSSRVSAQTRTLIELLGNGNLIAFSGLTGPGVPVFDGPHSMTIRPESDFVRGVAFDVQVGTLAGRDAYDGQVSGFAVLVSDVGDGRAAVYSKLSNASGNWSAPAYITGGSTDITVNPTNVVGFNVDPSVTTSPSPGSVALTFNLPGQPVFSSGVTTTLPPDQPASGTLTPVSNGYRLDLSIPRGPTGDITGVTPFWNTRLGSDTTAAAARDGLGISDVFRTYWGPTNLEMSNLSPTAILVGMDGGTGFFDSFNSLAYVDTASATNLDTSEAGALKPAFGAATSAATLTLTANSAGWPGYNIRVRVPSSQLSGSGSRISLRFEGPTSGVAGVVASCFVGHAAASGDTWDMDGNQKQLTVSGSPGFNLNVGAQVTTDFVDFAYDRMRDLIVSIYVTSGDLRMGQTSSGPIGGTVSNKAGANEAGMSDVTGYTTSGIYDRGLINRIQVQAKGNMLVGSSGITLPAVPQWCQLFFIINAADAVLNTDFRFLASRNRVDFTYINVSPLYSRLDGSLVVATPKTTLSITSGMLGAWQARTFNGKSPKLLAAGVIFGV